MGAIPLGLVLLVHLALGVVADHTGVDETTEIQSLCSELRHDGVGFVVR